MNRKSTALGLLLLLGAWPLTAQQSSGRSRHRSDEPASPLDLGKADSNVVKKRIEAYLDTRLKKIEESHQARMDFYDKESDTWQLFWDKVREERKLFEVRMARQKLDIFSSLASLDPRDHAITIADFERMQSNVIKSFELQQKQKMAEFFAARDARWKDFAAAQERERNEFVADAEAGWQEHKSSLKVDAPAVPASASARSSSRN